jgi:hypothetical protein
VKRRRSIKRGKSNLRRTTPLARSRGPKTSSPWKPFPEDAVNFTAAALDRSRGLCVVSGEPAVDAHHVIPKRAIRRYVSARVRDGSVSRDASKGTLRRLLWDQRNGIAVSRRVHDEHENRKRPIPRRCIPEAAVAFARELELEWMIERDYPKEEEDAA